MARSAPIHTLRSCVLGAALLCVALPLASCATGSRDRQRAEAIEGLRVDPAKRALNTAMSEFALEFSAVVEEAADRIALETDDPAVELNALRWKTNAIPEARATCFRLEPLAAQFDMWALLIQMDTFFTDGAGSSVFGAQQHVAIDATNELLEHLRVISRRSTETEDAVSKIENDVIRPWADENPIESLSFHRRSSIIRFADYTKEQGGTIEQFANLEEYVAKLMMIVRVSIAEIPRQARWEAELLVEEQLEELQAERTLRSVDQLAVSVDQISASVERMSGVAVEAPALVASEREVVLAQVQEDLEMVIGEVDRIRLETLEAVASERILLADDLERIAHGAIEKSLREGFAQVDQTADRTADRVMLRVVLLLILGLLLAPVVAHVYVRVWPKGR